MIRRMNIALVLLLSAWPAGALSADQCEGRDPVPHDDGNYRFSSESWVRNRFGATFYGRCVKVLLPTTKLKNHWEGVLPAGIAREDRPTQGGRDFFEEDNEDRIAPLHYGNSDDVLDASYLGHRSEAHGSSAIEPEVPQDPKRFFRR